MWLARYRSRQASILPASISKLNSVVRLRTRCGKLAIAVPLPAFCIETLENALARYGKPEIFNTDKTVTGHIWTYVRDDRPFGGRAPPAALYYAS